MSIGWWYLSSVSPKGHCCRVSAADKGWRVYPLDPHPDVVVLYSGCTPGKRGAWGLPDDRHTASLVGLRGGLRHARTKLCFELMDPILLCPGKDLVLPTNFAIDEIAKNTRSFIFSLPNNEMSGKSPFAIFKALQSIGEPKSVKKNEIHSPKLLTTIKAGFLNSKFRPYLPKHLRYYKCQRFGYFQTSCRGQLTCSTRASVGHSSTDCTLVLKCPPFCHDYIAIKISTSYSVIDTVPTPSDNFCISAASSSSSACPVLETITTTSKTISATSQEAKETSKHRRKKRPPKNKSNTIKPKIEIKMASHRSRKSASIEYTTDEEDMIVYDVGNESDLNPKYV
ncbi:uncharacterized protein TNCV_932271 [Trichonephila clavipes]|nr:uncharacterized protein TNCV_932271 [Trichonephila clavipes]